MKKRKLPVDELLRLACSYGADSLLDLAEATKNSDPQDSARYTEIAHQMYEYRVKRWGQNELEKAFEDSVSVPVTELLKKGSKWRDRGFKCPTR